LLDGKVIKDARAFAALKEEWEDLHRNSLRTTPFQSWDWLHSWWEYYGKGYELRLVTLLPSQRPSDLPYLAQKVASPSPVLYDQLAVSLATLCKLRSANLTSSAGRLLLTGKKPRRHRSFVWADVGDGMNRCLILRTFARLKCRTVCLKSARATSWCPGRVVRSSR
jgi:hypothetical protein